VTGSGGAQQFTEVGGGEELRVGGLGQVPEPEEEIPHQLVRGFRGFRDFT
jgi:hypothetical protein